MTQDWFKIDALESDVNAAAYTFEVTVKHEAEERLSVTAIYEVTITDCKFSTVVLQDPLLDMEYIFGLQSVT